MPERQPVPWKMNKKLGADGNKLPTRRAKTASIWLSFYYIGPRKPLNLNRAVGAQPIALYRRNARRQSSSRRQVDLSSDMCAFCFISFFFLCGSRDWFFSSSFYVWSSSSSTRNSKVFISFSFIEIWRGIRDWNRHTRFCGAIFFRISW